MHRELCPDALWHDYFMAPDEDKLAEVSWALSRPSVRKRKHLEEDPSADELQGHVRNFEGLLTATEHSYLAHYK
eukprot:6854407-Alexandrium_andersonii.AAC.1